MLPEGQNIPEVKHSRAALLGAHKSLAEFRELDFNNSVVKTAAKGFPG